MEARIRARFGDWRGRGAAGRDPDLGAVAPRRTEARLMVEPGGPARVDLIWVRPADLRPDTRARRAERLADALALQILNRRLERIAANRTPGALCRRPGRAQRARRQRRHHPARRGRPARRVAPRPRRDRDRAAPAGRARRHRGRARPRDRPDPHRADRAGRRRRDPPVGGAGRRARRRGRQDNVFVSPAENLRLFEAAVAGADARAGQPVRPHALRRRADPLHDRRRRRWKAARAPCSPPIATRARCRSRPTPSGRRRPGPIPASARPAPSPSGTSWRPTIGATAVRFANGVRLTVKKTDFAANQVMVQVRFGDGQLALPADRPNPSWALGPGFAAGGLGRIDLRGHAGGAEQPRLQRLARHRRGRISCSAA